MFIGFCAVVVNMDGCATLGRVGQDSAYALAIWCDTVRADQKRVKPMCV